jgi:hypothetical protein
MRWTNSWGLGLNRIVGRAPGHCVLRWGQDVPSVPHAPFLAPALFLGCASDSFSLTKPNTSCKIEWPASLRSESVRVHPGMPFGFTGILHPRIRNRSVGLLSRNTTRFQRPLSNVKYEENGYTRFSILGHELLGAPKFQRRALIVVLFQIGLAPLQE